MLRTAKLASSKPAQFAQKVSKDIDISSRDAYIQREAPESNSKASPATLRGLAANCNQFEYAVQLLLHAFSRAHGLAEFLPLDWQRTLEQQPFAVLFDCTLDASCTRHAH